MKKSKSALLKLLVRNSTDPENQSVSINKFFIETLKLVNADLDEEYALAESEEDKKEIEFELLEICRLLLDKGIVLATAQETIEEYIRKNGEYFFDRLIFHKFMADLSALAARMQDPNPITAVAVIKRVLAEPSSAIRCCFAESATKAEAPTENAEGDETIATLKRRAATSRSDIRFMSDDENAPARRPRTFEEKHPARPKASEEKPAEIDVEIPDILEEKEPEKTEEDESNLIAIMDKVTKVRSLLTSTVFGQDHAVSTFVSGYFQAELAATLFENRNKPRATFLFAGPPGVGKTFLSEQAAKGLELPFKRFDMSEYSEKEANLQFCGSDKVYSHGSKGLVTSFVAENPKCVLLFDEIEKAHLNVIYLFLQILDAGRLRDNFTSEEVSFADTIIIFTTNAGKRMYEDESINLLTASKKTILKALSAEINPVTNVPMFPPAICSRFASGNVVMFNRMGPDHLLKIAAKEMDKQCKAFEEKMGIAINVDKEIPYALLFGEGGKADARMITAKSVKFINGELYELFRLINSSSNSYELSNLKSVSVKLAASDSPEVNAMFNSANVGSTLVFTGRAKQIALQAKVGEENIIYTDSIEEAKNKIDARDAEIVLCDITYEKRGDEEVLNAEDVRSQGFDLFVYALENSEMPVYLLVDKDVKFSEEEKASLFARGIKGLIDVALPGEKILSTIADAVAAAQLKRSMSELARANKVLTFGTLQKLNKEGDRATIGLYDLRISTAIDADDNENVLSSVSKPKVRFNDVIGAHDAKAELTYFIQYLKDPVKFVRKGIKAPNGILLYGPPGTGKTLLAKAMAGESDVTFLSAEGNQFLKRWVGQGAEAVHDLFATARKYAPAILFIDEIDAIAKNRQNESAANTSGDILTAFLTEMDGFNTDKSRPVFVLAATNYGVEKNDPRGLDPALLRRFDRRIYVDLPDKEERIRYMEMRIAKIKNHKLSHGLIENVAIRSTGMSLAELDSVFELALRNVIKNEEGVLTDEILEDAFESFNSGEVKKWNEDELVRTARHEAGHALVCWSSGEKPSYLTIVARGNHGGYMQHGDTDGKGQYTRNELLARVRTALGGRAAEVVYYGDEDGISTGASGDLQSATSILQTMICSYGMDEKLGLCTVDLNAVVGTERYSDILSRVGEKLAEEFENTKNVILKNKKAIDALVTALMERNSLKGDEIEAILSETFIKA